MLPACSSIFDDAVEEEIPFEGKLFVEITGPYFRNETIVNQASIRLKTEQIYGCVNYRIENTVTLSSNIMIINISQRFLEPTNICAPALGPAIGWIPVNLYPGNYLLSLNIGSHTDYYSINYEENNYILKALDISFSAPLESEQP